MRHMMKFEEKLKNTKFELLIEWSIFLIFMVFLLIINFHSNLFFHTAIELFINVMFILVFVFTFNTYGINRNNSILILGTGCFFVAVIGIFHLLMYQGMPFLENANNTDISAQLWIAARYLEAFTGLISLNYILKPSKKLSVYGMLIIYICISISLLLSIVIFNIFPTCYIGKIGLTPFKIISEYIISIMFLSMAVIYFRLKAKIDRYLFFCIESFFILSAITEMFFTSYVFWGEWRTVVGHIIKVIAVYFLYKGIVETGLKKPYYDLNYDLGLADNKLKQFEEILYRNEQCFNMIINNSDNAIFVINDNKFIFANKRMAELMGLEKVNDAIGLDVETIMVKETKNSAYDRINNAIYNKLSTPFTESKMLRMDGKIIDIEVTNCFCMYKNKPSAMVMFRDITLKKQLHTLERNVLENKKIINETNEHNKMMVEFFSNISHELKTPLNVILGAIQLLSLADNALINYTIEAKLSKYLKTMKQNCYRLVRLVNNLVDMSKFDSGYFKLDLHNHDIVNVVEGITLSVVDYAKNKGIELLFDTDAEEKEMAIDLDKIERIMLNLLSNAIKFTNEGGQILVSLWDKEDKIVISIKDNGTGIPADKLDFIFERFGQVDKTLARNKEGSGIGLSLVKSIVDMHEGNIKVLSEFGQGSEFIIELPSKLVEDEQVSDRCIYESRVEKINVEFSDIYS
ncbi:MASE3 domain-containing protein [Clostridium sp. BL-8]|uniref:sensor histidine kinase n=1 Tax=Clostridium sp. BL-8 TaxID=349938 RepID=UPI00098C1F02|nr:MASE3 domain-containing protein [Clostridium sp. BL-8]OOM81631.1 alkaline phosphatase synthesis sensor protein PhoR [Clostridium sp. BL-8]